MAWRLLYCRDAVTLQPGEVVGGAPPEFFRRTAGLLMAAILCLPQAAAAQVGLTSGVSRVTLVAHAPPHGSIDAVSAGRLQGLTGNRGDISATLRLSTNTGYRLVVKPLPGATARVWVKAATGGFEELTPGGSVTVAHEIDGAVEREREVEFRIEVPAGTDLPPALPVRYDLAIDPTL